MLNLTLNTQALTHNYKLLKQHVAPCPLYPVLKANAYGLGVDFVVPLLKALGNTACFVATSPEGIKIRALDSTLKIYVLHGLDQSPDVFLQHDLIPVVHTEPSLHQWNTYAHTKKQNLACMIQWETGLNRLGLTHVQATDLTHLTVHGVITHLAYGYENHTANAQQIARLHRALPAFLTGVPLSYAASGWMMQSSHWGDIVRVGRALYGYHDPLALGLQPVLHITAPILGVKTVKKHESVGYNGTFQAQHDMIVGIIEAGYAEGYPAFAPGTTAYVTKDTTRYPLLCPSAMDLMMIDMTHAPLYPGDTVTLVGDTPSLGHVAQWAQRTPGDISLGFLNGLRHIRSYI